MKMDTLQLIEQKLNSKSFFGPEHICCKFNFIQKNSLRKLSQKCIDFNLLTKNSIRKIFLDPLVVASLLKIQFSTKNGLSEKFHKNA